METSEGLAGAAREDCFPLDHLSIDQEGGKLFLVVKYPKEKTPEECSQHGLPLVHVTLGKFPQENRKRLNRTWWTLDAALKRQPREIEAVFYCSKGCCLEGQQFHPCCLQYGVLDGELLRVVMALERLLKLGGGDSHTDTAHVSLLALDCLPDLLRTAVSVGTQESMLRDMAVSLSNPKEPSAFGPENRILSSAGIDAVANWAHEAHRECSQQMPTALRQCLRRGLLPKEAPVFSPKRQRSRSGSLRGRA